MAAHSIPLSSQGQPDWTEPSPEESSRVQVRQVLLVGLPVVGFRPSAQPALGQAASPYTVATRHSRQLRCSTHGPPCHARRPSWRRLSRRSTGSALPRTATGTCTTGVRLPIHAYSMQHTASFWLHLLGCAACAATSCPVHPPLLGAGPALGASLVHYLSAFRQCATSPYGSALPAIIAKLRRQIDAELPGLYCWFDDASLHVTVRGLMG